MTTPADPEGEESPLSAGDSKPDRGNPLAAAELFAHALDSVPATSAVNWEPPAPAELQHLLPQYEIGEILGRGGMGAVYKAVQPDLGRHVAIKLLPSVLADDENFVARFRREARTLASLEHPGIIHIHDFGQTSAGHLYFVMEFVDGTDLYRMIHGPGLSPAQTLEIISQICDALQYAHGKGVIHRDIKPANILITREGRAKVADFGLARPAETGNWQLTVSVMSMGTPDYMAPEQKRGGGDHRIDLYALGVMLYEMLCGRTPQGAWQPPSQRVPVDVRLDQVVTKAMQEEPDRRYQQASEVKTDVDVIRTSAGKNPKAARKWLVAACCLIPILALGGWVASRPKSPALATAWDAGSPDTESSSGDLSVRRSADERLKTFEGHTYAWISSTCSWTEGDAFARKVGGHLVTITSEKEQAWLFQRGGKWFIGGRRPDKVTDPLAKANFTWVTGEPMTYDGWMFREPGRHQDQTAELFMALYSGTGNRGWFDVPWNEQTIRGIIIEWDSEVEISPEVLRTGSPSTLPGPKNFPTRQEVFEMSEIFEGHTYAWVAIPCSWPEADAYARNVGGHLVTVTSGREQAWLLDHGGRWFIGGRCPDKVNAPQDKSNFTWVTGEPMTYDGWRQGEPGNFGKGVTEPFMGILSTGGKSGWGDFMAKNRFLDGFIVEWDSVVRASTSTQDAGSPSAKPGPLPTNEQVWKDAKAFQGHTYAWVPSSCGWTDADDFARKVGGHLATITSAEEQQWVVGISGKWFIGGHRPDKVADPLAKGNFTWVTGEPMSYDGWMSGEPGRDRNQTGEPVMGVAKGGWCDLPGNDDTIQGFIVEWDTVDPLVVRGLDGKSGAASPSPVEK